MKTNLSHFREIAAFAAVIALAATASAAPPAATARLDRADIALGDSAELTITVSGNGNDAVSPPTVPGLEFVAAGQSSQYQSINGVAASTTSVIYHVIPQRTGTFAIPALRGGSRALVLHVLPGGGRSSAAAGSSNSRASSLPPPATSGLSAGETRFTPDGSAFVRLLLPKRELFVGETVPVEIQVGLRRGLVASLNGLPTLNGDAFTLNKLSAQPEEEEEMVEGKPYTMLIWHSALAAVKPGDFSLTVETPLTVRMRAAPRRRPQMPRGFFDDSLFDDVFNDSFFQDFFGGTTEKQLTVASEPDALKVLALPAEGRPAGFGAAVGNFEVSSKLSAAKTAAGDPLTLRLKVAGTGDFDRVNSAMLGELDGWKTYPPTAKFEPADSAGCSGEKVFEQAVIPMQAGRQTVPALVFSFFNPDTRRYETKRTAPLSVEVIPGSGGGLSATAPAASPSPAPASEPPRDGLRPDHIETGRTVATLRPLYFQPWFVGIQSALALGFAGGLFFLRRRERRANDLDGARQREASRAIANCLAEMDAASAAGDAARFFESARAALQRKLASRWSVAPPSITIAEIDARLNGDGAEIRRIFALADQAAYSGQHPSTADFQQWKEIVLSQLKTTEEL